MAKSGVSNGLPLFIHYTLHGDQTSLYSNCCFTYRTWMQVWELEVTHLILLKTWKISFTVLHPRASPLSAVSPETRRAWTGACIPHTSYIWKEMIVSRKSIVFSYHWDHCATTNNYVLNYVTFLASHFSVVGRQQLHNFSWRNELGTISFCPVHFSYSTQWD